MCSLIKSQIPFQADLDTQFQYLTHKYTSQGERGWRATMVASIFLRLLALNLAPALCQLPTSTTALRNISNCIDGIREEGGNLNQMWVLINSHYGSNLLLENITQDYRMLWLEKGSISKRWILKGWLSFACHVLSVAQMEVRKTLVTVFHKKKMRLGIHFVQFFKIFVANISVELITLWLGMQIYQTWWIVMRRCPRLKLCNWECGCKCVRKLLEKKRFCMSLRLR